MARFGAKKPTTRDLAPYDPSEPGYESIDTDDGADETDDDIFAIAANATEVALDQANLNVSDPLPDNSVFVPIISTYGGYFLTFDEGNFYLGPADDPNPDTFIYDEGIMSTPDGTQLFHYYNDTMKALGVSRFRITELAGLPKTSDLVTLTSVNADESDSTPGFIVAVNTVGETFYTVLCSYSDDQDSKFFLVKDIESGIAQLQSPDLKFTVTGGDVSECEFWPLGTTLPGAYF